MTGIRRTVLLVTAIVAVVLGGTPAQAALSDASPALAAGVTTVTVAAPTNLSTGGTRCWTTTYWSSINGVTSTWTTTTMQAKVSWKASTTPRVTNYVIVAHFGGGQVVIDEVPASVTSLTETVDGSYSNKDIRVTVTAKTDYGWTAESQKSGVIKC